MTETARRKLYRAEALLYCIHNNYYYDFENGERMYDNDVIDAYVAGRMANKPWLMRLIDWIKR